MNSVAITGYYATGSGAVYNLLQEYSSVNDGGLSSFEHIFLYDINGVFETIDRILYGNSLFNSNAAISAFRRRMLQLHEEDYIWFGGYKYKYGNQFLDIIEEFIADITEYSISKEWYGLYAGKEISSERIIKDTGAFILGKRNIGFDFGKKTVLDPYNKGEFSFANKEKLQIATKKLVNNYLKMVYGESNELIALNHMLSPQDAFRVSDYMPEDFKLIIVDRDVRDIYIYNKYVWGVNTFPTELHDFIRFTKSYRLTERPVVSRNILRVQFEDLVYKYDNTVHEIEEFLQLDSNSHIIPFQFFDPKKAIKNTQVFRMDGKWDAEVEAVKNAFPGMVYDFPYTVNTSMAEIFDA